MTGRIAGADGRDIALSLVPLAPGTAMLSLRRAPPAALRPARST
jgi:hypothetical protein